MVVDYDEATCITAGELRARGLDIPADIPDVGWVPRDSIRLSTRVVGARDKATLEVELDVDFTVPFRWVDCVVKIER